MSDDSPEFTSKQRDHAQNEKAIRAIEKQFGWTHSDARKVIADLRRQDYYKAYSKAVTPQETPVKPPLVTTTEIKQDAPKLIPVPPNVPPPQVTQVGQAGSDVHGHNLGGSYIPPFTSSEAGVLIEVGDIVPQPAEISALRLVSEDKENIQLERDLTNGVIHIRLFPTPVGGGKQWILYSRDDDGYYLQQAVSQVLVTVCDKTSPEAPTSRNITILEILPDDAP